MTTTDTTTPTRETVAGAEIEGRATMALTGPATPRPASLADLASPGRVFVPRIGEILHGGARYPYSHLVLCVSTDTGAGTLKVTDLNLHDNTTGHPRTMTMAPADLADADPVRHRAPAPPAHLRSEAIERAAGALADHRTRNAARLAEISEIANRYASEFGWCETFDEIAELVGLPRRQRNYTATVSVSMTLDLPLTATDPDNARAQIGPEDIEQAMADYSLSAWDWEITDITED